MISPAKRPKRILYITRQQDTKDRPRFLSFTAHGHRPEIKDLRGFPACDCSHQRTDAFWTDGYAQDLYSYATPGEECKPVGPGPFVGIDESFARRFAQALANKLKKRSYLPFFEKYGQGYLLVPIQHPYFNGRTVQRMKEFWRAKQPVEDQGCFKEVYIAFSSLNHRAFRRWHV